MTDRSYTPVRAACQHVWLAPGQNAGGDGTAAETSTVEVEGGGESAAAVQALGLVHVLYLVGVRLAWVGTIDNGSDGSLALHLIGTIGLETHDEAIRAEVGALDRLAVGVVAGVAQQLEVRSDAALEAAEGGD